ncbi:MAG: substrate-binding domain-containing protein [Nocardioidaceae bacterium]
MSLHVSQSRPKRYLTTAVAVAASSLLLAACGSSSDSGGSGGSGGSGAGKNSVTFMPKSLGNKYFEASDKGGKTAVTAFKGTFKEAGATEASPTSQSPFIQTATQQQTGAIVLAANDPKAVCSDLNAAKQAGVKVVTFDSDTECRDLFINQVTVAGVADGLVDLMGKHLNGKGKIGIESGGPNATNLNAWVAAIKTKMASKYPGVKIVDVVYGNDVDADSYNAAKGLIQSHSDLNGIIAPDSVAVKEAAHFISDSPQYKSKIWLTGLGLPSELKGYVKSGVIEKFGLWNPEDLGYLAAYAAHALIDGTITGKEGDTFTAGKLGKYTVGKNGEVVLGPLFVFDKSNVDQFAF